MGPIFYFLDDDYATNVYHEIILSEIKEIGSFFILDDPEVALSKLEEQKPDYLFLDINMPKISGWEIVDHIQKSPENFLKYPYQIFMLTTSSSKFDHEKLVKYPIVKRILEKPLSALKIKELI